MPQPYTVCLDQKPHPTPNETLIFQQHLMQRENVLRSKYVSQAKEAARCPPPELQIASSERYSENPAQKTVTIYVITGRPLVSRIRRATEIHVNKYGGSIQSVLCRLFLKNDPQNHGRLGPRQVASTLKSLDCPACEEEVQNLISYYADNSSNTMPYQRLIRDVARGSRHFLAFPSSRSLPALFTPRSDPDRYEPAKRTPEVVHFIRKLQSHLLQKVARLGMTEQMVLDHASWKHTEHDLLSLEGFMSMLYELGLRVTPQDAQQIYDCFSEAKYGGVRRGHFVHDVLSGVGHWSESCSARQLQDLQQAPLSSHEPEDDSYRSDLYRYTSRAFRYPANAVVETTKQKLGAICEKKSLETGDASSVILMRAFVIWDGNTAANRGKLTFPQLCAALHRLRVHLSEEEAREVMRFYDIDGSGMCSYNELIKDVARYDRDWLTHSDPLQPPKGSALVSDVRTSPIIDKLHRRIKQAAEAWAAHFRTSQAISAQDALHGICLKYDQEGSGRVSVPSFEKVCRELRLVLTAKEHRRLLHWYLIGGGKSVDYCRLINGVFPEMKKRPQCNELPSLVESRKHIGIKQAEHLALRRKKREYLSAMKRRRV